MSKRAKTAGYVVTRSGGFMRRLSDGAILLHPSRYAAERCIQEELSWTPAEEHKDRRKHYTIHRVTKPTKDTP